MKYLLTATLLLVSIILIPGAASAQPEIQFLASASGAQEVPPVRSRTRATISINFRPDLRSMRYVLGVNGGVGIFAAHLHCGAAGTNGPVVVVLGFGGPFTVRSSNIIPATCGLPINNIASLLAAIRADLIYLNVHSAANPGARR